MKWTLAYAVAFAVAATTTAFTLVPGSHTSAGVTEAAAQVLPAQNVMDHPRGTLVVMPLTTWTVGKGDTLSGIAKTRYGKEAAWPLIYWANHKQVKWANRIQVGQTLQLPIPDGPIPAPPRLLQPPPPPVRHILVSYSAGPVHRVYHATYSPSGTYSGSGTYSFAGLEALWISAGGPSWAASHAASIAECESGGRVNAYNPSGATGLWQILGSVVGGSLTNSYVNAANAVAKFKASGDTFAQWVCQ